MKFAWWYVSMGITAAVIFGSMVYLGNSLCVPVENNPCVPLLNGQTIPPAPQPTPPVIIPIPPPPTIKNSTAPNPIPVGTGGTVEPNGNKTEFTLSFVMSKDFADYAFNALNGQPGHNPDIIVKSGDTVTIHIKNDSKSFHAFGVVIDPEEPNSSLWKSAFKTADNPMKPSETGDVTFVAGTPGLYHYICTVPGHADLGMNGNFIVK